ncbi:UNVERIFIED_CONTAM: hypothetical protein NCL1_44510 [Trichonephila clavipes]
MYIKSVSPLLNYVNAKNLDSDESDIEIAVLPDASELAKMKGMRMKKSLHYTKWETQAESNVNNLLKQMETALKDKTLLELFEQFYSIEVYKFIVIEIARYTTDVKNEHNFLTTADEIPVFIGFIFCFELVIIQIPVNVITGQMLMTLKSKSYLHFVDNGTVSQHAQNQSFNVKTLFAIFNNNNFTKFGHYSANLSNDEMTIMYYSRNSLKQFT